MKSRLVPVLCCLAGVLLIAGGVWAIASYARAAMDDRSMLFWALVILGIGCALLGAGACLLLLARNAWHGDASAQVLARNALLGLCLVAAIALVAGHARLRQAEADARVFARDAALQAERTRNARRLGELEVVAGNDALSVRAQPTPGLDGHYRWTLQVSTNEAALYQSSRMLWLQGATAPVTQHLRFDDLFAGCFGPVAIKAYACVRDAGASDVYTVRAQLELVAEPVDGRAMVHPPIRSVSARQLTLDTRTSDRAVVVLDVD